MFVNRKDICKFKANDNKNINYRIQFSLESIYGKFGVVESREASFKGNVYDLPANYNTIDKCSGLFSKCFLCCWVKVDL